jgi:hypothetical protein
MGEVEWSSDRRLAKASACRRCGWELGIGNWELGVYGQIAKVTRGFWVL